MTQTEHGNGVHQEGTVMTVETISISGTWVKAIGVIVTIVIAIGSFTYFIASRPDRQEVRGDAKLVYAELSNRIENAKRDRDAGITAVKNELSAQITAVEHRVAASMKQLRADTKEVRDLLLQLLQNQRQQTIPRHKR